MFATLIFMTLLGPMPGESMLIARDVTHVKVYMVKTPLLYSITLVFRFGIGT